MWSFVILSVPFPQVRNRKGTESGRCQRTFKDNRHSKILVLIPTCGIFPCWIAMHRIDNFKTKKIFLWDGLKRVGEALPEGGPPLQNFSKIIPFLASQDAIEVMLSLAYWLTAFLHSLVYWRKRRHWTKKGTHIQNKAITLFHFLDNLNFHH